MKAKEYELICHAVQLGVASGVRRAYKHIEHVVTPPDETQQSYIVDAVIDSICEWFDFDDSKFREGK